MNKKDTKIIIDYLWRDNEEFIKNVLWNEYHQILTLQRDYWKILDKIIAIMTHEFIINQAKDKEEVEKYKKWLNDLITIINIGSEIVEQEEDNQINNETNIKVKPRKY